MQNAFTIDVEDYYQVSAFDKAVNRVDWKRFPSRVENNTRRILDMLDRHRTRATFFVLGCVAEQHPEIVKEIDRRGHEVACHGYSHRLIYSQTIADFTEETRRSKAILEQQTGKRVLGYRAASYSITHRSLWAIDVLNDLGFEYDSSIFPVRHDRYGIPGAPRFPHVIERPDGRGITEFPVSTLKIGNYHLPVGGGGYFRVFPYRLSAYAISFLNRQEMQPAMFYLHPWEIDPEQPRIRANIVSRFRHYHNLHKCQPRLERLLASTQFGTAAAVLAQYPKPLPLIRYDGAGIQCTNS